MSKIILDDDSTNLDPLVINENFRKIEEEFNEKVLYRENPNGEPNEMENDLDMNGNRIYNLPKPVEGHEPLRLSDIGFLPEEIKEYAEESKEWAEKSQDAYENTLEALAEGSVYIGDYGPGLVIEEYTNFFGRDGIWWRPSPDLDLPYTTTGNWSTEEGLFVAVGDQALRQELSSEEVDLGTGMIGHEPGVTAREAIDSLSVGISALTAGLDKVREELPVSAAQFPSLSDALNSENSVITIPGGVYELPNGLVVDNPNLTEIRGNGDTILDLSNAPDPGILIDGGLTSLPAPTTIDTAGGMYIHFPPEAGIEPGDVIILWNPDAYSLNQWREYYRDGFMARVSEVNPAGRVTIYGTIPEFNRSSIQAFKLANNNPLKISGITIIPPAGSVGMSIRCRQNVHIDPSVTVLNGGYAGIEIERCFDVSVLLGNMSANHADSYPLIMSNTQKFTVSGLSASSTRHAVGLGGSNRDGSVPTRDGIISNCIFENDGELGVGVADIHGNATGIIYDSCVFNSSAHLAGKNNKYIGCTIYGRPYNRDGLAFFGGELSGGVHEIIDCTVILTGMSPVAPFGIVHLSGKNLNSPLSLVIRGLTLLSESSFNGTNTNLIRYEVWSTTNQTFSFDISGLYIAPSVTLQRLVFLGVADSAPAQFSPRPIVALELPKDSSRFVEDILNIGTFPVGNLEKVVY